LGHLANSIATFNSFDIGECVIIKNLSFVKLKHNCSNRAIPTNIGKQAKNFNTNLIKQLPWVGLDYCISPRSRLKLSIMLSLLDGNKKLADLKDNVNARETSILHALKEFENLNLTNKTARVYKLTSLGFMEAQILKKII
jgi:hypothetical protein